MVWIIFSWFYSWCIYPVGLAGAKIVSIFNKKVRATLFLRKEFGDRDTQVIRSSLVGARYWIHVASVGELEYSLPILRELELRFPNNKVILTYYSISAKERMENISNQVSNVVVTVPLPHDGFHSMKKFVSLLRGSGVSKLFLLKYEFWPGLLLECFRQGFQVYLVGAMAPSRLQKILLSKISMVFTGYASEIADVLHPQKILVGDTRVDQILNRLSLPESVFLGLLRKELLQCRNYSYKNTLICGSFWKSDFSILLKALKLNEKIKKKITTIVLVSHEPDYKNANKISSKLTLLGYHSLICESELDIKLLNRSERPIALIIQKKGILLELYGLGKNAWVGGGFRNNVHNVLEPALAGCRVLCGPKVHRSPEAKVLQKHNCLKIARDLNDVDVWLSAEKDISCDSTEEGCGDSFIGKFIEEHRGAAFRIVSLSQKEFKKSLNFFEQTNNNIP